MQGEARTPALLPRRRSSAEEQSSPPPPPFPLAPRLSHAGRPPCRLGSACSWGAVLAARLTSCGSPVASGGPRGYQGKAGRGCQPGRPGRGHSQNRGPWVQEGLSESRFHPVLPSLGVTLPNYKASRANPAPPRPPALDVGVAFPYCGVSLRAGWAGPGSPDACFLRLRAAAPILGPNRPCGVHRTARVRAHASLHAGATRHGLGSPLQTHKEIHVFDEGQTTLKRRK